jgi:hypothetical protein
LQLANAISIYTCIGLLLKITIHSVLYFNIMLTAFNCDL